MHVRQTLSNGSFGVALLFMVVAIVTFLRWTLGGNVTYTSGLYQFIVAMVFIGISMLLEA